MSLRSSWVRVVLVVAAVTLLGSACSTEQGIEAGDEPVVLSCASDREGVVGLLQSGLPTYDYEPALDLAALVETSDVVLAGLVGSVGRLVREPDPNFGDDSWTVVSVESPELLYASGDVEAHMGEFSYATFWPDGARPDPLAADITVEDLAFVAFLDYWESAPGTYAADVQGLVVDCVDGMTPTPVIEPLSPDVAGVSLADLAGMVKAISEDSAEAQGDQSAGVTVERGRPLGEPQIEPGPGEVRLWVSNQSFVDDPIHLTIAIGGLTVVEERFEVRGQHNWIAFDIKGLQPGVHTITAESDTGANVAEEFTVREDEPRWLVLDYWYSPEDPEGRHFTLNEFDKPVGFA